MKWIDRLRQLITRQRKPPADFADTAPTPQQTRARRAEADAEWAQLKRQTEGPLKSAAIPPRPNIESGRLVELNRAAGRVTRPTSPLQIPATAHSTPAPAIEDADDRQPDEWDYAGYSLYDAGKKLKAPLHIDFTDKGGARTTRRIEIERYDHDGIDGLILAHCHLRGARRPFRLSRIIRAMDPNTGESIDHLPTWLDQQYQATAHGIAQAFIDNHEPALGALFHIAKQDGAFRAREKHIIATFGTLHGLPDHASDELIAEVASWQTPSAITYGKHLRALADREPSYQAGVLTAAQAILNADKGHHTDELKAIEKMRKILKPSADHATP